MTAGKPFGETERPRCLLLVSLPTKGLLEGFEAGKWTIVEAFLYEGEAKLRLHQILELLTELQARALVVVETALRSGATLTWSTSARFNSSVTHITSDNAVQASPQALAAWATATKAHIPSIYRAPPIAIKPSTKSRTGNSEIGASIVGLICAVLVASIGIVTAYWRDPVQIELDPKTEFARQGGVYVLAPDRDRPDWYVRAKFNPNGTKDIVDRFPASELKYRRGKNDLDVAPVEFLNPQLNGIAAPFRPNS